jgi:DNA-binding NtrC family response regulator
VLKRGSEVTEYDLDSKYQLVEGNSPLLESVVSSPTLSKEENEKRLLRNALIKASGNRTRAAELIGISRRTLHRKLIQWPELDIEK